ncbi:MAG: YigZ family protein [Clostridia bacterium]|nr:YigZ family protein [Clostridia bacterium]
MEDNVRITVKRAAAATIEERKSEFIANVAPVSSEEEAREFIDSIKKKYYDARHNVFAYVLDGGSVSRFTDDGEPKGSAGIPVLNVLKMTRVDGVCVVVTRYFGGILLGTGGLVRAYSAAAKAALDEAGIAVMRQYDICTVRCSYSDHGKISSKLDSCGAHLEGCDFADDVLMTVSCAPCDREALEELVRQVTAGKGVLTKTGSEERPER